MSARRANPAPSRTQSPHALISQALSESDRTFGMSAKEFFDDFRARNPEAAFPTMIDQVSFTAQEDAAISRWAKITRQESSAISRVITAAKWSRAVKSAYADADQETRGRPGAPSREPAALSDRVLARAREIVSETARPLIHYLPCYLLETPEPEAFAVGDIKFIPGKALVDEVASQMPDGSSWVAEYERVAGLSKEELRGGKTKRDAEEIRTLASFPWIAVVHTDAYESTMSQIRARDAARLAIAGIGLNVHARACATLSLAYEWPLPLVETSLMQVPGGHIAGGWTKHRPQLSLDKMRFKQLLQKQAPYFTWLGDAIRGAFASTPVRAKLRDAWLNALHWYYVGCMEPSDARATICYVSALESLSDGQGAEPILQLLEVLLETRRDAIAIPTEQWSLEEVIAQIHGFARSEMVHGGRFVLFCECAQQRSMAAELCQYALLMFQEKLRLYEARYRRASAADNKKHFLRALSAK